MTEDDEKRALEIELMTVQIDRNRLDMKRIEQEMRWEPYKALAAIVAACAAITGVILALSHFIH